MYWLKIVGDFQYIILSFTQLHSSLSKKPRKKFSNYSTHPYIYLLYRLQEQIFLRGLSLEQKSIFQKTV